MPMPTPFPSPSRLLPTDRELLEPKSATRSPRVGSESNAAPISCTRASEAASRAGATLLDVEFDLHVVAVIDAAETAQRRVRLSGIAVPEHDQTARRDTFGHRRVALDLGAGHDLKESLDRGKHLFGFAGHCKLS